MVFAGNGYVINKSKINPYEGLDVAGKIIVVAGLPAEIAAQQAAAGRGGRGGRMAQQPARAMPPPPPVRLRPPGPLPTCRTRQRILWEQRARIS